MRTILSRLFKLVVTNFFDDFCQLEVDQLQTSAWKTAEMVMELLGWDISKGDDKRRPFEKSFEILGAVVSLESSPVRCIRVSNKESRITQIQDMYRELEKSMNGSLSRSFLESLKGRLLYAAGHTYGRCTQLPSQLLHRVANVGAKVDVTPELVHCVCMAVESLVEAIGREKSSHGNIIYWFSLMEQWRMTIRMFLLVQWLIHHLGKALCLVLPYRNSW